MSAFWPFGGRTFAAARAFSLPWLACAVVLVAVVLWTRLLQPVYLAAGASVWVAAAALLLAALRSPRSRGEEDEGGERPRGLGALTAACVVLAAALAIGGHTQHRLGRVATEWPALAAEYRTGRTAVVEERVTAAIRRARRVVELASERAAEADGATGELFASLEELRRHADIAAVAVFSSAGDLTAWTGEHRGDLPVAVRAGGTRIVFAERPLFSYLYVSSAVDGRSGHTVAVLALESSLPVRGGVETVAEEIARRVGARPDFATGSREDASWELVEAGETIVHARFDPVTQTAWRERTAGSGRGGGLALAAAAFLLLALASARRGASGALPLALAAALVAVAPLGTVLGLDPLFSPAFFLLPLAWDVPLGIVLAVCAPLAALVGPRRRRLAGRSGGVGGWVYAAGAVAVAVGFAGVLHLFLEAAGSPLLQGGAHLWGGFQVATVVVLATIAALAMPGASAGTGRVRALTLAGGLGSALVLVAVVLVRLRMGESVEPWFAVAWALPFAATAHGLADLGGRRGSFLRWLAAGSLAASAVLPQVWATNVTERLDATERELRTLGSRADPFADYLLRQFAFEAIDRARIGEEPVSLLYRGWVASGLARSGFPVRITLWNAERGREVELALSGADARPSRTERVAPWLERMLDAARERGGPIVEAVRDARAGQAMASPLPDGRMISVVVPPRRSLDRTPVIAPFLGAAHPSPDARLTLVPAAPEDTLTPGAIHWRPTERGWRSDLLVSYPDGDYHAHFEFPMPSAGVLIARGVLLLALDLGVLALLWLVGSLARGETPRPAGGWNASVRSFRARVTLALFGFFLLPVALFGATAYRALAGEVTRAGRTMAEHAVTQAVEAFPGSGGDLAALADYTGHDVLYYYRGELARASSPATIDLGLYGSWMPPDVFHALGSGEAPSAVETRELGGRPYLVAYRRLPAAGALGVPVSLRASEAATRQRELAHLILFAVLMGAVLSTTLSVAVGRALARPIGRLRRAAAEVGAGRLDVGLPEKRADEFGELFASF
ncbi:MAG: HAMP domain-containing protein, partial [Gemmatimonadota bacterium]